MQKKIYFKKNIFNIIEYSNLILCWNGYSQLYALILILFLVVQTLTVEIKSVNEIIADEFLFEITFEGTDSHLWLFQRIAYKKCLKLF